MLSPRFLLLGAMLMQFSYEAYAMNCNVGGVIIGCPTILNDGNQIFCCQSSISSNLEVCCDIEDFLKQNTPILAGVIVGIVVILLIITICCCCFCSCCFCARRRVQRGTVLYGRVGNDQNTIPVTTLPSTSPPSLIHAPPASQYPPPPAYQPPTNPNFNEAYYPPQKPNYNY